MYWTVKFSMLSHFLWILSDLETQTRQKKWVTITLIMLRWVNWCMERNPKRMAYFLPQGLLNVAATFMLVTWAVSKRGPTFPPMFTPLSLIFVTIAESLFMGLEITLGRSVLPPRLPHRVVKINLISISPRFFGSIRPSIKVWSINKMIGRLRTPKPPLNLILFYEPEIQSDLKQTLEDGSCPRPR